MVAWLASLLPLSLPLLLLLASCVAVLVLLVLVAPLVLLVPLALLALLALLAVVASDLQCGVCRGACAHVLRMYVYSRVHVFSPWHTARADFVSGPARRVFIAGG